MFWWCIKDITLKMAGLLAEICWFLVHFMYLIKAWNMEQIKKIDCKLFDKNEEWLYECYRPV